MDVIAVRELYLFGYLFDWFFDGATKIAAADAVLDGHVARIRLTIDFGSAVLNVDVTKLSQRNALTRRRHESNSFDRFLGVAVRLKIPDHQIIALLAL